MKRFLYILFPFIPAFMNLGSIREDIKGFDFWGSTLGWSLKLYTLSAIIPLAGIVLHTFGCLLQPDMMRLDFFEGLWEIPTSYYFTGSFLDVAAWRWQLALLLVSFLFTWMMKDGE